MEVTEENAGASREKHQAGDIPRAFQTQTVLRGTRRCWTHCLSFSASTELGKQRCDCSGLCAVVLTAASPAPAMQQSLWQIQALENEMMAVTALCHPDALSSNTQ